MRCLACNNDLTDFESTRMNLSTGEYYDLCNDCFKYLPINPEILHERYDLYDGWAEYPEDNVEDNL